MVLPVKPKSTRLATAKNGTLLSLNNIRAVREELGVSQEELATKLGCSKAQVSRLETDKRGVKLEWIGRIATALDVQPSLLLDDDAFMKRLRIVMVQGAAEAHRWVDKPFFDRKHQYRISAIDLDERYQGKLFAVVVSGLHANLKYADGTHLVLLKPDADRQQFLIKNKRYLVQRTNNEGQHELTIRRLDIDSGGEMWLVSETTEPSLLETIRYHYSDPATKLIGRVIKAFTDE